MATETKAKHTPGPWGSELPYRGRYEVRDGNDLLVAEVGCGNSLRSGIDKANATLIAAAPDLLEIAIRFLNAWESPGFNEVSHGELAKSARAAIAKATA